MPGDAGSIKRILQHVDRIRSLNELNRNLPRCVLKSLIFSICAISGTQSVAVYVYFFLLTGGVKFLPASEEFASSDVNRSPVSRSLRNRKVSERIQSDISGSILTSQNLGY